MVGQTDRQTNRDYNLIYINTTVYTAYHMTRICTNGSAILFNALPAI